VNPEGNKILSLSMQRLAGEIAPMLGNAFAQGQVGLIGFMLTLVANEYERGADLRANENREMRELFSDAARDVRSVSLKSKLELAAATADTSLRISALNQTNWELRRLLIELHAHVETQTSDEARQLERTIWVLLRHLADARMVKLGPA
jgi:hypothetical protein